MFTISQAAKLYDLSPQDVRNFIARGHVKQFGAGLGSGRERTFGKLALYELGIVLRLAEHGLSYEAASQVVTSALTTDKVAHAFGMIGQHNLDPSAAFQAVDNQPDLILQRVPWNWRDLTNPALWVFITSEEGLLGPKLAEGWDDVGRVARELIATDTRLIPFVGASAPAPEMPKLPDGFWDIDRPHVHVFNLTATLVGIDRKLESLPNA